MRYRVIRVVVELDEGLNPMFWSAYVREDGRLMREVHGEHVHAFSDWDDVGRQVLDELAKTLINLRWWS